MTTAVAVEEIPVPDPASGPYGLANGPDGAIWTALESGTLEAAE